MGRLIEFVRDGAFVLVVSPPRHDVALVRSAFDAGATAVKVHLNVRHAASGTTFGSWTEEEPRIRAALEAASGPVGLMPGAATVASPDELARAAAAGVDFFDVYARDCPAWLLEAPMGRVLALGHGEGPAEAAHLAALGAHALEASVVPTSDYGRPLTAADLGAYRALAAATTLPVLVPSQKRLTPEDLPRLAAVGVRGVLLGVVALGDTAATFAERLPAFAQQARRLGRS